MSTVDDTEKLQAAVELADRIIEVVRETTPESLRSRDRNDLYLGLAFSRALRCFRSIRDIAAVHAEADDALVLTRALMVMCTQGAWVAKPDESDERLQRGRVVELASRRQLRTQARDMERLGMSFGMPATGFDDRIRQLEEMGTERPPSDEQMAREVGMEHIYARIYRSASDVAHYSLFSALTGFDVSDVDGEIESFDGLRVRFLDGEPARAAEAVGLAALVYVSFLELSEPVVHHGAFEPSKALLEDYAKRWWDPRDLNP